MSIAQKPSRETNRHNSRCAHSVLPTFMRHPRLFKPESIANVKIEIQIVDTHETLDTPVFIGLQAFGHHLNRTLLRRRKKLNLSPRRQSVMEKSSNVAHMTKSFQAGTFNAQLCKTDK
jgi:hypothetical protein